ncbi:DUF397 domain-containing protein [Nocardia sp. NPDC050406]|uniref:DUF397 domain-containing protein n=1 Tax=Nocardia sp. NPDC050406 TaxID=3364318 RepID=UPI00378C1780
MTSELSGAEWFKSSRSHASGECVEAAHLSEGRVGVRDSKRGGRGPVLVFDGTAWDAFIVGVANGAFGSPDPR